MFSFLFSLSLHASATNHASPMRLPFESYTDAMRRVVHESAHENINRAEETAWDRQSDFHGLNIALIPEMPNFEAVNQVFLKMREERGWSWEMMPEFQRRLPWLYPADGCYLRADLMVDRIRAWGYPTPYKIFLFGDLLFRNQYETASWWYHVAPVFRVGNQVYVIDPAAEPRFALPIKDWALRVSDSIDHVQFSICQRGAITPEDVCDENESSWDPSVREQSLQQYLGIEWQSLESILGDSPEKILGDSPPWKQ